MLDSNREAMATVTARLENPKQSTELVRPGSFPRDPSQFCISTAPSAPVVAGLVVCFQFQPGCQGYAELYLFLLEVRRPIIDRGMG